MCHSKSKLSLDVIDAIHMWGIRSKIGPSELNQLHGGYLRLASFPVPNNHHSVIERLIQLNKQRGLRSQEAISRSWIRWKTALKKEKCPHQLIHGAANETSYVVFNQASLKWAEKARADCSVFSRVISFLDQNHDRSIGIKEIAHAIGGNTPGLKYTIRTLCWLEIVTEDQPGFYSVRYAPCH